jgi:hypothetical protein
VWKRKNVVVISTLPKRVTRGEGLVENATALAMNKSKG